MLNITNHDGRATLEADSTTMQLVLGAAIETLLMKKGSPAHRTLYASLSEAVRSRAPWPLSYDIVPPEEMLRRLESRLSGTTYWYHPESDSYFVLEDGETDPRDSGDADGAMCVELTAEQYQHRHCQPTAEDLDDLLS